MEIEERISDANLCMAKLKRTKAGKEYQVYSLFIYDEAKDKICTPTTYFNGDPKYLNLHKGTDGKKYVYMDKEVVFFRDIMGFEEEGFHRVIERIKRMMPEKAFDVLFRDVIVPSIGSGVPISNLVRANGQFVTKQMVDREPEATK